MLLDGGLHELAVCQPGMQIWNRSQGGNIYSKVSRRMPIENLKRCSAESWMCRGVVPKGGKRQPAAPFGWACMRKTVAPGFKNKTRYTPYVSPGSQISHIATNKGNINRQCSIYNVLSIKNITLDSKQRKDNSDLRVKTPIPQGQLTGWSQA